MLPASGTGIFNVDNPWGRAAVDRASCRIVTYGLEAVADVRGSRHSFSRSTGIGSRAAPTSTWSAADWSAPSGSRARSGAHSCTHRSRPSASRRQSGSRSRRPCVPSALTFRPRPDAVQAWAATDLSSSTTRTTRRPRQRSKPSTRLRQRRRRANPRRPSQCSGPWRSSDPPREASTKLLDAMPRSSVSIVLSPSATRLRDTARALEKPGCPPSGCSKFAGPDEAIRALMECAEPGNVVLVKGSQSSRMERVASAMTDAGPRENARTPVMAA